MKRARTTKSQLTGGSGDVNPQYMVSTLDIAQGRTNGISGTPLPIPRLQQQNGKQLVMEFLQVDFCLSGAFSGASGIPQNWDLTVAITTNPNQLPSNSAIFQDPRAIAIVAWNQYSAAIGTPADVIVPWSIERIKSVDLTDEAGHGILVATDTIYITGVTTVVGLGSIVDARIMYRFKEVGLAEYVGIVQSQQ